MVATVPSSRHSIGGQHALFLPDAEICPCTLTMSWLVAKIANQPTNFAFGDTNILSTPEMRLTLPSETQTFEYTKNETRGAL